LVIVCAVVEAVTDVQSVDGTIVVPLVFVEL
jgi:hypothetical protein